MCKKFKKILLLLIGSSVVGCIGSIEITGFKVNNNTTNHDEFKKYQYSDEDFQYGLNDKPEITIKIPPRNIKKSKNLKKIEYNSEAFFMTENEYIDWRQQGSPVGMK
jgi:hypothetical protein